MIHAGEVPVTTPSAQPKAMKALVLDLDEIIPFVRSVAYAVVSEKTTTLEWRKDTNILGFIYEKVFRGLFGEPGTAEVVTAHEATIRRAMTVETFHFMDVLMARAASGPAAVAGYLKDLDKL